MIFEETFLPVQTKTESRQRVVVQAVFNGHARLRIGRFYFE